MKELILNPEDWKFVLFNDELYMKFKKIADNITYDLFMPSGIAILTDGKNITRIVMEPKGN